MSQSNTSEITLTYKFLLILSTLSAVFFCYLYVSKPVKVVYKEATNSVDKGLHEDSVSDPAAPVAGFESLSSNSLPGESTNTPNQSELAGIPLAVTPATAGKIGWEETNDRIQHVVTAEYGKQSQRVLIEVPVIYETRGLRFGPDQAKEAQRVLRALKIYQQQIKKLHQDGKNIQMAWNSLLMSAQPIQALRADSPSLPQVSAENPALLNEHSSRTIQVSQ